MSNRGESVTCGFRRYGRLWAITLGFIFVFAPPASGAAAPAGELVQAFGGDGSVLRDFGRFDVATAVAMDARGRTVVAGDLSVDGSRRMYVARFRPNGKLDRKFSGNGIATTGRRPSGARAEDLVIQPDGRIVVVGYSGYADEHGGDFFYGVIVARFRPDGRLDRSFAQDGIRGFGFPGDEGSAQGTAVDLDTQGRICVGAQLPYLGVDRLAVARLLRDGTLDYSFSDDGLATADGESLSGLVTQGDHIVVAGASQLVRFSADGEVDLTFGDGGAAPVALAYTGDLASSSSGDLLVAGTTVQPESKSDLAVLRLTADGAPDDSFSSGGVATADFYGKDDFGAALTGIGGDKVLVVGTAENPKGPGRDDDRVRFAVARFDAQGGLDTAFSGNGKFTWAPRGSSYAWAKAVAPVPGTTHAMIAGNGDGPKPDYSLVIALR